MGILELRFLEKYGRLIFKQNNKKTTSYKKPSLQRALPIYG